MDNFFNLGIVIFAGVFLGHFVTRLKLPSVAGYVIAGLIIGPSLLNIVTVDDVSSWGGIVEISLAFIAFSVGTELFLKKIKAAGTGVILITVSEVVATWVIVTLVMYLLGFDFFVALLLGALASSTSPAPILLLKKQFNLKNKLIENSITITALDDALGIVIFGISLSLLTASMTSQSAGFAEIILPSIKELGVSLIFGGVIGWALAIAINTLSKKIDNEATKKFFLEITLVGVVLSLAFAHRFEGSPILLPLVTGLVFTNFVDKNTFDIETKVVDLFSLPFQILFFTVAGIHLDISQISQVFLVGMGYVISRGIGKYGGAYLGSKVTKQNKAFTNRIGFALFPLGGVEIGLVLSASLVLSPEIGGKLTAIVLMGTLIYSTVGSVVAAKILKSEDIDYN